MDATSTLSRANAGSAPPARQRRVIDAPTRMFHWLFALSFLGAYVTAESERWRLVHVTLGYAFAGLLVFRLVYGLFGPQPVRLSILWRKVAMVPGWLAGFARGQAASATFWRQGQAPVMGLVIFALMLMVVPLTLSGYATYNDWGGEWLEEIHEFFGNFFLFAVLAHLALIAGLSLLRRRNLAWPMVTGRMEGAGPDLVRKNRSWLAALVLLAVVAFGVWQWQQAPAGAPGEAQGVTRSHGDDD